MKIIGGIQQDQGSSMLVVNKVWQDWQVIGSKWFISQYMEVRWDDILRAAFIAWLSKII